MPMNKFSVLMRVSRECLTEWISGDEADSVCVLSVISVA